MAAPSRSVAAVQPSYTSVTVGVDAINFFASMNQRIGLWKTSTVLSNPTRAKKLSPVIPAAMKKLSAVCHCKPRYKETTSTRLPRKGNQHRKGEQRVTEVTVVARTAHERNWAAQPVVLATPKSVAMPLRRTAGRCSHDHLQTDCDCTKVHPATRRISRKHSQNITPV